MNTQAQMTPSISNDMSANNNMQSTEQKKTPLLVKLLAVASMMTMMGGTLTGVMTYMNLGFTDSFFTDWLSSFLLAAVTVMPLGFTLMALLTKLAETLLPNTGEKIRNVLIGLTMACIMESGIALSTAINNIGINDLSALYSAWLQAVLGALPVALTLMVIVSLTIKPKIEALLKS